jgi:hypothetical protein
LSLRSLEFLTASGAIRIIGPVSERSTKRITAKLKAHREWLPQNGEYLHSRSAGEIRTAAFDPTLHSLQKMADSTHSLGLYYGARGLVKLQDGADGWPDLAGAVEAYLWCARLQSKVSYPTRPAMQFGPKFLNRIPLAVCLLAYFVAAENDGGVHETWSLLQKSIFDPNPRVDQWWYERRFEPFFAALYARVHSEKIPLDPGRWDLGIYAPIIERWEDDQEIADALSRASDYHLNHMENTSHWSAEFNCTPFDLIPVELHAVQRLRCVGGLKAVEIDNPLITSFSPIVKAQPPDDLLASLSYVKEKYREFK